MELISSTKLLEGPPAPSRGQQKAFLLSNVCRFTGDGKNLYFPRFCIRWGHVLPESVGQGDVGGSIPGLFQQSPGMGQSTAFWAGSRGGKCPGGLSRGHAQGWGAGSERKGGIGGGGVPEGGREVPQTVPLYLYFHAGKTEGQRRRIESKQMRLFF